MNSEVIAKLVGVLGFQVNTDGLQKFRAAMTASETQMKRLAAEAAKLQKALNLKMGITGANDKSKLDAQVRNSLDRELKLETRIAQARRAVFTQELAGQKLQFANSKELAFLQTASLKRQQEAATLQAKAQKAEQARLQTQGLALRNEGTMAANKARALRGEQMLAQQQARTIALQQKQRAGLTQLQRLEQTLSEARTRAQRAAETHVQRLASAKVRAEAIQAQAAQKTLSLQATTQRIEQGMEQARERSNRQGQKYLASQEAAKLRAAHQETAHQQRTERFQWAQTRQAQWVANQNKPEPSTGFLGLGTGALAVGGAAAGAAAIIGAINALGDRLAATQERVSDSQSWTNTLEQAGGKNVANQKYARDEFLRIGQENGSPVDLQAAKDYRTFLSGATSRGMSLSGAIKQFETQQQAFRAAGMSKTEQDRATLQLGQVRSKGHGDTEDFNTLSEAAPLLAQAIREAWAVRTKFKGKPEQLNGAFAKALPNHGYLAADADAGMSRYVAQNQEALQKQSASIAANQQRLDNAQYIQQQGIDQSPDLINAINDRIKAETELTAAMEPLKLAAAATDAALMKLAATFLRWTIGKDSTPEEAAKKVDTLSPDKAGIDPNAINGSPVSSEPAPAGADPVDRLYQRLFGKEPPRKAADESIDWGKVQQQPLFPDAKPQLDRSSLNGTNWSKAITDQMALNPVAMANMAETMNYSKQFTAENMFRDTTRPKVGQPVNADGTPAASSMINSNNTTTFDVATPVVTINVTALPGMDTEQVANLVDQKFRESFRSQLGSVMGEFQPKEVH